MNLLAVQNRVLSWRRDAMRKGVQILGLGRFPSQASEPDVPRDGFFAITVVDQHAP